jgi:hypothetical protein
MAFHLFVFLLVIFLFLCLALLWRLCWFPLHQRRLKPVLLCGSLPILDTGSRLVAGAESLWWQVAAELIYVQVKKS